MPDDDDLMKEALERIDRESHLEREMKLLEYAPSIVCIGCAESMSEGTQYVPVYSLERVTRSSMPDSDLAVIGKMYPTSTNIEPMASRFVCICLSCITTGLG